jgi:hypothetical protein
MNMPGLQYECENPQCPLCGLGLGVQKDRLADCEACGWSLRAVPVERGA